MVVAPQEPGDETWYSGGAGSHLPMYVLGRVHVYTKTPLPHFTPAPQMPQPSARCTLRQLAAPWVSSGQKMSAAHTPHIRCSRSLQQSVILKCVLTGKLIRKQGYCLSHMWFYPTLHTCGAPPQAGHMHIQAHGFPGGEGVAGQCSLLDSSFSLTHT